MSSALCEFDTHKSETKNAVDNNKRVIVMNSAQINKVLLHYKHYEILVTKTNVPARKGEGNGLVMRDWIGCIG